MKTIKLTESQYNKLFESVTNGEFGEDNTKEIYGNEVLTSPTITDKNGEPEPSKPATTDDFQDTMSPQQWGVIKRRS